MSTETRFALEHGSAAVLRRPATPPATMAELGLLKEEVLGRPGKPSAFYDDLLLCHDPLADVIWEYDERTRQMAEVTNVEALRTEYCSSIRASAPLTVSLRRDGEILSWHLGPHDTGQYSFVLGNGAVAYDVPGMGGYRLGDLPIFSARVKYHDHTGWVTYSPELTLEAGESSKVSWRR